jgi:hypothetical protein
MLASEIVTGLYQWWAPHPEWTPGAEPDSGSDWEEMVGSVLYEAPHTVVLIDPQLPADGRDELMGWLDELVAGRPVSVLTTIRWHRRDREELAARYASNGSGAWNAVPSGVVPRPLRGAGETMYWLPAVATLVAGDRLITRADGKLRLCPESWMRSETVDRAGLAHLMRALIELPIERVLVSHGRPVLQDGRAALARAIDEASAS